VTHSSDTFETPIRPRQAESYASAMLNRQFCGTTDGFQILDQGVQPLEYRLAIRLLGPLASVGNPRPLGSAGPMRSTGGYR
jgi:hypothetical protein